jgi:glycosyltransferase involved in cell wall biosynthesis
LPGSSRASGMAPMRVCHVISGDLWAGAEMVCLRLLSGLRAAGGVELSAVLLNEGKLAREIRALGVATAVVDETRLDFFRIVPRVKEIVRGFGPDIVHTHRLKENVLGFLATRRTDREIPLICTQHGLDEPQARMKWKLASRANRYVLSRKFERVVAVSEDMRDAMTRTFRLRGSNVVVIHNGTEVRKRVVTGRERQPFVIGSAGRLFPVKDFPLFVEVAAAVHRQSEDIRFELAGEGPELATLLKLIGRHRLGEVFRLKGFVEDMSDFYLGLDLYVNTSLHEGLPMSVLEAMSHGLPVVAPLEGGIREVVGDGVHGFLVGGRDVEQFANKCIALSQDRSLLQRMSAASRERVAREFSLARMAEKYLDLYREVVSARGGTSLS